MLRAGWGWAGAHDRGWRPGITRCQDKGPPTAWPLTIHSLPQPQIPGLPTPPGPARVGPGIVTGLPHSATELFILTRAAGGGRGCSPRSRVARGPEAQPISGSARRAPLGSVSPPSGHLHVCACVVRPFVWLCVCVGLCLAVCACMCACVCVAGRESGWTHLWLTL